MNDQPGNSQSLLIELGDLTREEEELIDKGESLLEKARRLSKTIVERVPQARFMPDRLPEVACNRSRRRRF